MVKLFINKSLAEQIKKEIIALSKETTFKEIHLTDLNLPFCKGCSICFRKGHELCPHNIIVQNIIDEIDWSDGVIFTTTTFNMQPTALTKNLIDHLCFMLHRPYFFTKKAIVASTVGGVGARQAVKYLAGTLRALGFNKCYELPVASYSWNSYILNDKVKDKCKKLASVFHKDVSSMKNHPPALLQLIPYNMFRGMSLSYVKGTEYETFDGIHWSEPERAKHVYDPAIPAPPHKKLFGSIFYCLGRFMSKYITITYRK